MPAIVQPTVFISYSLESETHNSWVARLAAELQKNGVEVVLDQWTLRIGDDLADFMDTAVARAGFILLVCTDSYAEKVNARRGGVGYEQAMITGGLLTDTSTAAKLVPVLRSGSPATALPRYLKTRLFVDMRSDDAYERSIQQLLRHFFGQPEMVSPPLGPVPSFVARTDQRAPAPQAFVPPTRWVLVAGTGSEDKLTQRERETATRVGEAIATCALGLISGGWPGVDDLVARAFAGETARQGMPLENSLIQVIAENRLPTFPAGDLILVNEGRDEWIEGINRADAVVLIGGLGGTRKSGELAAQQGKPVFPLADTGRDAKQFYMRMLKDWDQLGPSGLPMATFQRLARPAPAVVDDLADLLRAL